MAEPIDYSKTQRIVLLVDLHPLITLQNPNHYLTSILATSTRLLTFSTLRHALFAFKLYFSSLSPLRSISAVNRLFPNLSAAFNHPSQTLNSITETLSSISIPIGLEVNCAKASYTASSLLQLVHEYVWETDIESLPGKVTGEITKVSRNLVVLFSRISRSLSDVGEYMDVDVKSETFKDFEGFQVKCSEIFGVVRNTFDNRGIHFSWIDVKDKERDRKGEWLVMLENGIRDFGWGISSTDYVVLGSALIPFGLIYPEIGVSFDFLKSGGSSERCSAQLNLEILDVNGKPLECKFCDLELLNPTTLPKLRSEDILNTLGLGDKGNEGCDQEETFWSCLGEGSVNMRFKAVKKCNVGEKIEGCSSSYVLVQESARCKTKYGNDTCVDGVLDVLFGVKGQHALENSTIMWKVLSFLYKESYWALVTVSNSTGNTIMSVLRPLTAQLALLSRIEDGYNLKKEDNCGSIVKQMNDLICGSSNQINDSQGLIGFQTESSTSANCKPLGDGKRKKNKKCSTRDLTWSSFLKAAFECNDFELVDICFSRQIEKSTKLKFLKCWMKQIKKSRTCLPTAADSFKSQPQQPFSTHFPSDSTLMQEGDAQLLCSETAEAFFNNLPKKIQHGLQSGRDLQTLAERLVKSSIHALSKKYETDGNIGGESQIPKTNDSCCKTVLPGLMKILLRKPKEMKEKLKHDDSSSEVSDFSSISENIVREFELQILLRMEILGSTFSVSIKESFKQKMVKEICSFLEIIQYLVEGGIHGHVSLYDYVERTIRLRYHNIIEDVVNRIYTEMDLLPFGDEDEKQAHLFNSEDSNQSWREKQERYETAEANNMQRSVSADDESCQPPENIDGSSQLRGEGHARKLSEARDRREKARRFGSFTRMPDLQRVWAPKQLKAVKTKCEDQKELKRKERRKGRDSIVYETPMSGRWSFSQNAGDNDEKLKPSSSSVSKALFQDW